MNIKRLISILTLISAGLTAQAQERIVSATGNASEIIANLGLAESLVGVDTTSTEPAELMDSLPKVGYRRNLSAEGILSLNPDLLILAPDAGPPNVLEQLKVVNVPLLQIQDDKSINGLVNNIELIANTLGAQKQAKELIAIIRQEEKVIAKERMNYKRKPKIAILMDGTTGQLTGLGRETAGDSLVHIVGGENAFTEQFKGMKAVSRESLIADATDMIIISTFSEEKKVNELTLAKAHYPEIALSQAGKNDCIFRIDAVKALGFGPKLTEAALQIAQAVNRCLR